MGKDPLQNGVGIIIVHYRNKDKTWSAVENLVSKGFDSVNIYIADNSDSDEYRYESLYSEIILAGENRGFASGVNRVLRTMTKQHEWFLVLNDDAVISPGAISIMLDAVSRMGNVGFVSPTILQENGLVWSRGGAIDWKKGTVTQVGLGEVYVTSQEPKVVQFVDYAPGCVFLVNTKVYERIGGMDESYFMYFEETDWCIRARYAGYYTIYVPWARAYHQSDWRTDVWGIRSVLRLSMRNSVRFFKKFTGKAHFGSACLMGLSTIGSHIKMGVAPWGAIVGFFEGVYRVMVD